MNRRHFLRRTAAATAGLALALPRRGARTDERERDGQRRDHRASRRQQGPRHVDGEGPRAGSLRTSQRHRQRPHHPCGGRRRASFQRLAVLREAEVRRESEDGDGFPPCARRQRRGCGDHRRSRSLACAHDDLGLPGGQGRLRRKAHQPQHRRRPTDDRGRAALRPHRRGRNPEAQQRRACQGGPVPSGRRAGHRLCGQDRGLPPENSHRSRCRQRRCRRASTTICGSDRRLPARSTKTTSTITGTGSGSTARPTLATRASTRWTPCAGCWESRNIP